MKNRFQIAAFLSIAFLMGCGANTRNANPPTVEVQQVPTTCPAALGDTNLKSLSSQSISQNSVRLAKGNKVNYTLTAGYLPVYEEGKQAGRIRACMYFWYYSRDDQTKNAKWPVSFLFNGGPTSSSAWIQFGGNAPKTIDLGPEGITVPTNGQLKDDPYTLLANSDLVFLDPVNSGLSRPAQGVSPSEFNGISPDARSIGDFINTFLTTYNRRNSPKYIVGESYGGMRTPVLSRYLDENLGIKLEGITLISPWMDAVGDTIGENLGNDLPYVMYLPEYTTAAWYHKRLPANLQALSLQEVYKKSESFAQNDYVRALMLGSKLTEKQKNNLAKKLSQLTSFSVDELVKKNFRLGLDAFVGGLLKDRDQSISYYDGRMAAHLKDPTKEDPTDAFNVFFSGAVGQTLKTLNVGLDVKNFRDLYDPPTWSGANPNNYIQGGYLDVLWDINKLMTNNPQLKMYVASGLYDYACPASEVDFLIHHLPSAIAARFKISQFAAGHPVYFSEIVHQQFASDLAAFYGNNDVILAQP